MTQDNFDTGFLIGLTVAEGSFTGDKQQPALQYRFPSDDLEPLRRLNRIIGGAVYGPYHHGERSYTTLVLRGPALYRAAQLFFDHLPPSKKRRQLLEWWQKHAERLPPLPETPIDSPNPE